MSIEFKRPSIIDGHAQIYKSISETKQLMGMPTSFLWFSILEFVFLFLLFYKWWLIIPLFLQLAFLFILGKKDPFLLKSITNDLFKSNILTK